MPRSISAPTIAGSWWRVPTGDGFRVIDAFSRIIRLGEGVSQSGRFERGGDRARGRGAAHLPRQDAQPRRDARAPDRHRGVPRSGQRPRFSRPHRARKSGLELEIIDRETEARLAATGCTPLIDPQADGVLLFDIGGGSSELVRLDRSPPTRRGPPLPQIEAWVSLPVGVVTLAERHGGHQVTPRDLRGDDRGGRRAASTASWPSTAAWRRSGPSARHLGHGDHDRRRASRTAALRAPPGRRLLDGRRRGDRA